MADSESSAGIKKAAVPWQAVIRLLAALAGSAMLLAAPSLAPLVHEPPLAGWWEPARLDGGSASLVVSGRAAGPFMILWKDGSPDPCGGELAVLHGTGSFDPWDPNAIQADMRSECPSAEKGLTRRISLRFHPLTGTLSMQDSSGKVSLWKRSRNYRMQPPALNLRVNYGDDWVESFYEPNHKVWVTVTEPDGMTVRATTEAITEPQDYWQGEPGFSSLDWTWLDSRGKPTRRPPDIRVGDWVFGWADNGASASVQIGDIRGVVDPASDSIAGTISASWLSDAVVIECLDWWSGNRPQWSYPNRPGGFVHANGADRYSCSWAGLWDVQAGYGIGVSYTDENDNWVANAFRSGYFTVFPEGNALEGWDWPDGAIMTATIEGAPECTARSTAGYTEDNLESTFFWIDFPRGCYVDAGDRVTLTDGTISFSHTVQQLEIKTVDAAADTVAGTAEDGAQIVTWVHGYDQGTMRVPASGGRWLADFGTAGFDITNGMCGRAEIRDAVGMGTAVDWCLPGP